MPTITQQQYKNLIDRQEEIERNFVVLKDMVRQTTDEDFIDHAVLQKWGKISLQLDRGKGRHFSSFQKMRKWLADLP